MDYKMDYEDQEAPQQIGAFSAEPKASTGPEIRKQSWFKNFRLPTVVTTAIVGIVVSCGWYALEAYGPEQLTPSYNIGRQEAKIAARVKASDMRLQARVDQYNAGIKLHNDQEQTKFQSEAQAILDNYKAVWEQRRLAMEGLIKMTEQFRSVELAQIQRTQSSDVAVANLARMFGRIANAASPSAGDGAMQYSEDRKREMLQELSDAANSGGLVHVEGLQTDIPSPEVVVQLLEQLRPTPMPYLPPIGEDVTNYPHPYGTGE